MHGPSPDDPYPMAGFPQVGFLRPLVKNPNIVIGEYTYYDDPEGPDQFEQKCVLYHFPFVGERLVIGKFCALARGVKFIMNGANHALSGFSTFPFTSSATGGNRQPRSRATCHIRATRWSATTCGSATKCW